MGAMTDPTPEQLEAVARVIGLASLPVVSSAAFNRRAAQNAWRIIAPIVRDATLMECKDDIDRLTSMLAVLMQAKKSGPA